MPPEREAAYLAGAGELAAVLQQRGQHLWVFRHPTEPQQFLEFREAGNAAARSALSTPVEQRLVRMLRGLGTYAPGMDDLWLEVPLTEGRTFATGSE